MHKVTIRLEDDIMEKIRKIQEQDGQKSVSECARDLVDFAIRVKKATDMEDDNSVKTPSPLRPSELKRKVIESTFETRFLVRFLMANKEISLPQNMINEHMEKAKSRAAKYTKELLGETESEPK